MITIEQVIEEARNLPDKDKVNQKVGNFGGCRYTYSDGDHCIAGQILVNLGIEVPDEETPETTRFLPNQELIFTLYHHGWFSDVSEDAIEFLSHAQNAADNDATWGDAILQALEICDANT